MIPMKSDPSLWRIVNQEDYDKSVGYAVTYVDDILVMAQGVLGSRFIAAIQDLWEASQAGVLRSPFKEKGNEKDEMLRTKGTEVPEMSFCGLQLPWEKA